MGTRSISYLAVTSWLAGVFDGYQAEARRIKNGEFWGSTKQGSFGVITADLLPLNATQLAAVAAAQYAGQISPAYIGTLAHSAINQQWHERHGDAYNAGVSHGVRLARPHAREAEAQRKWVAYFQE